MKSFLTFVGVLAWLVTVIALFAAFAGGGTDIQLIGAGFYATCGAVCLGLAAILGQFQQLKAAPDEDTSE
jgi:hypothetical protein